MLNRDSLLIFLTGLVVFTISPKPEFTGLDARFGLFAQEMLRNGPSFFSTTYDQPYPDYPGASTFMIYLVSLVLGKVTPFTAVLPVAIVSALVLVVTYRIGAIHSRQWGLCAVVLMLFTEEFFNLSRSLSPDQYVSLATVLSFYLVYCADVYGKQKRLWFIPLLFIAGFAFRGPIGLVIPGAVVCSYYLFNRDFKRFAIMAFTAAILFFLCFKGLLAAAAYQGGSALADHVWTAQMAGRIQGESKYSPAYYWIASFVRYAAVYPLAVMTAVLLFKKILRREDTDYRLLACLILWVVIILAGMSVLAAKKTRYIVPMIPAAALVASYMFIGPLQNGILSGIKKLFLQFCSGFPLGTAIVILAAWAAGNHFGYHFEANYLAVIVLTIVLAIAVRVINNRFKESMMRDLAFMGIGAVTFIAINIGIAEKIRSSQDRTGPFVQKVTALQSQQPGRIIFYKINADAEAIKFMVNLDKPIQPKFIDSPAAILSCKEPAYFIARDKDFADLPENVKQAIKRLDSGNIGYRDCIIFNLRGSL